MVDTISSLYQPSEQQDRTDTLEAANDAKIPAKTFSDWLENKGGFRAALRSLEKPRHNENPASSSKLQRHLTNTVNSLAEEAQNRRTETENPTTHELIENAVHVQITKLENGKYVVCEAILEKNILQFVKQPKSSKTPYLDAVKSASVSEAA